MRFLRYASVAASDELMAAFFVAKGSGLKPLRKNDLGEEVKVIRCVAEMRQFPIPPIAIPYLKHARRRLEGGNLGR
jgi:hypothetical protein